MSLNRFHPAVATWFTRRFAAATPVQDQAWPAIQAGRPTLISAPTGSGKTLAAFLAAIDALVREGVANHGHLPDETRVLYVSPLKALSNDIDKNLQQPLAGIAEALTEQDLPAVDIRTWVRTGDTPAGERERMRRQPPHIIVTTPESFYLLLTAESGRRMLATVRTVIVDEIHALAGNKRGAHLALSLERLTALCAEHGRPAPIRIGLSATQKPITDMAHFLLGRPDSADDDSAHDAGADRAAPDCAIIDTGHSRERDLALVLPDSPLEAVMANEVWDEIYDRLAALIERHRTTLIFVNTRRLAERAAHRLSERLAKTLGEDCVTAHHGSLSREHRLAAEQRLKQGKLRALVATASLELGIDIGDIDLVCQLGSPRRIAAFLQRVGRAGHAVGATPRGRLFPLTRDDLVESVALLDAVERGKLDRILMPDQPLDVLAQQIVAEVASREWNEAALYASLRRAWPYRALSRERFTAVVAMLAEGYTTRRGRRGAYLHRDGVHGQLRPRRGARLVALTNAGAIPDQFDYDVILQPEGCFIGSLNEDFAFESLPGDIFQLGNTAYRLLKVEQGKVYVEDAHGQPPNIPFWFGEAPGRSDELSLAVSRLREKVAAALAPLTPGRVSGGTNAGTNTGTDASTGTGTDTGLTEPCPAEQTLAEPGAIALAGVPEHAAHQLVHYLASAHAALGALPTFDTIILERFFDEAGDMHLVIHSPFGSRINRAWGLALRKRFCRKFNFELQAAATEDSIVLSLGPTHSFPLDEVSSYLKAANVREVLIQALLDAPLFATRWRWCANTALAVPRNRSGKRVPAQFQRSDAEDLIAVIFPDQLACLENISGNREIPEHPLVDQTLADCLHEAMDITGLEAVLRRIEAGDIRLLYRDLAGPSPLAHEVLNARPYAFLDDAPAEERRTLTVQTRHFTDPADAAALGRLDPAAITRVRAEAWPAPRDADEMHDALLVLGFLSAAEVVRGAYPADDHANATDRPAASNPDLFKPDLATHRLPDIEPGSGVDNPWPALLHTLAAQGRATRLLPEGAAQPLWVAAERLAPFWALFPAATLTPPIHAVTGEHGIAPQAALVELLRSRLEGLGPVSVNELGVPLGLPPTQIEPALLALEQEGYALRGRFTPEAQSEQWCERGLLARIHRYTLQRLRREVEPVSPADFMRFLFDWHHLTERVEGEDALAGVLDQLEGFPLPAAAWEADILPVRVQGYQSHMLDRLCSAGRILWWRSPARPRAVSANGNTNATPTDAGSRRSPGPRKPAPVRVTPICLLSRRQRRHWQALQTDPTSETDELPLSGIARRVHDALRDHGAAFFDDLLHDCGLLRSQVEDALGELVARGLVTADSFAGLRALIGPGKQRRHQRGRRALVTDGLEAAGRWSLVHGRANADNTGIGATGTDNAAAREPVPARTMSWGGEHVEHIARVLLRRYGVVMRKLLERESGLPPWRELLYVYRRLEARGEIRGGRFVSGFSGEQFALPEAVGALRAVRKRAAGEELIALSAADPLNLTGIVTPGERVPALAGNRLLYRDGVPLAYRVGGEVHFLGNIDAEAQWAARTTLLRGHNPARFMATPPRTV